MEVSSVNRVQPAFERREVYLMTRPFRSPTKKKNLYMPLCLSAVAMVSAACVSIFSSASAGVSMWAEALDVLCEAAAPTQTPLELCLAEETGHQRALACAGVAHEQTILAGFINGVRDEIVSDER
jgi:hypothetical protein